MSCDRFVTYLLRPDQIDPVPFGADPEPSLPSDAVWMLMESADGYTESFRLSELTDDYLLATQLNGSALTPPHGYPARFIFPGHYGMFACQAGFGIGKTGTGPDIGGACLHILAGEP